MIERRTVPIPVGGGATEDKSDVLFDAPLVREAINVRFEKEGSVSKRYGETVMATLSPSTSTYGEHSTVAEHDARAVVLTQIGAYLHDGARSTWVSSGAVSPRPSQSLTDPLVRQNNSSKEPEIALVTVNGKTVACIVWGDTDIKDGFYMWAEVPSDGRPLRVLSGPTMFSGTRDMYQAFRLTVIGTTVYCIASDLAAGDVFCSKCDASSTYTFSTPTSVSPGWGAVATPRALLNDGAALYAVLDEGVNSYSVRKLDTSFAETASQTGIAREALDAVIVGSTIAVICGTGELDTFTTTLGAGPTSTAVATVNATTGPLFAGSTRGTICEGPSSGFFMVWERGNSATAIENTGVYIATVTSALAVTSAGTVGGCRLLTRAAYRSTEGVPMVGVIDDLDPTNFRMGYLARPATDSAGVYTLAEAARFGQDVAVRNTVSVSPSVLWDSASSQWVSPFLILADTSSAYQYGPTYGINSLRVGFVGAMPLRTASASGLRLFAGGCGVTYTDGVVHAEVTPPPVGLWDSPVVATDASGIFYTGSSAEVTLYIALAPRWRDERGNLHRAAPIYTGSVVPWDQVGGVPDDEARRVRFARPFPATIRNDKGGQTYELEVYASTVEDGPFYFQDVVTPAAHPSKPGLDYIIISWATHAGGAIAVGARPTGADYIADVAATPATPTPLRWTEDNELAHIPPPPFIDMTSTQSRVWGLSAENGRLDLFPSKRLTRGYAPEFSTDLRIVLPDEGGEATAIAALADKVVVFKERLIYVIFGDPGDNTGAGSTVQTPRLVQGDVGCKEAQSVVEGPFGVAFRSANGGFFLLSPALDVTRMPALEDSLASYEVTSGVLVADKREVRWSLTDGAGTLKRTIVWDYEANAWATRTDTLETVHACTVGGQYTRLTTGGGVYLSRDTWSTSLDSHEQKITSAWIKLAGLQGFKRVWKTLFMLRWITGEVIIRIGYNYNPTYTDERTWTAAAIGALDASDGLVQLEVQHTIQKCESFRFQIEESNSVGQSTYYGEGFTLLGVQCEVGTKRGSYSRAMSEGQRK